MTTKTIPPEKLTPAYLKAYADDQVARYLSAEHVNEPAAEKMEYDPFQQVIRKVWD